MYTKHKNLVSQPKCKSYLPKMLAPNINVDQNMQIFKGLQIKKKCNCTIGLHITIITNTTIYEYIYFVSLENCRACI